MKKIMSLLVLGSVLFSCGTPEETDLKPAAGERSQVVSSPDEQEDFTEFLESFSTDNEFQLARIVFPLPDCTYPGDEDSSCDTIQKHQWSYLCLVDTTQGPALITKTYDNFNLEMRNTGERVLAFERTGTNVCSLYYFKLIGNEWRLVKRLVCGDD